MTVGIHPAGKTPPGGRTAPMLLKKCLKKGLIVQFAGQSIGQGQADTEDLDL